MDYLEVIKRKDAHIGIIEAMLVLEQYKTKNLTKVLEQIKSQLIDGGYKEDSVLINSINNLL